MRIFDNIAKVPIFFIFLAQIYVPHVCMITMKFFGDNYMVLMVSMTEKVCFAPIRRRYIGNLSKIKDISVSDFYDDNHTTPEGSDKIAKFIYTEVAKFLETNE